MRSRFVTIDLETRSACDLKAHGGHLYAEDPTTQLLTVAWHVDDEYHVWLPGCDAVPQALLDMHLTGVTVHLGATPPSIPTDRPWVGHNAFGFDELVWARLGHVQPPRWIDSMCLALAAGLPAGLAHIGERLWGEGKYAAGSQELTRASRANGLYNCDAENVPSGSATLVARYNVQDVRLTVALMEELDGCLHLPSSELAVIAAHRDINNLGVRVDAELVTALYRLSNEAVRDCVEEIARLTEGYFPDEASLRKRTRVIDWVTKHGVGAALQVADEKHGGKKQTLRRDVVNQLLAMYDVEYAEAQEFTDDETDTAIDTDAVALVCRVLSLRQSALRITGAKLEAAGNRVDARGVARALFAYWAAGTGRWAGRGIQVQNLPRAKEGVPIWPLLKLYRDAGTLPLDRVRDTLTAELRRVNVKRAKEKQPELRRPATADDAASGLIRSLFVPHDGDECLLAADLSAIEARVLAWLAGEQWLMEVFSKGGDPYVSFCQRVTGEVITKKDLRRQIWKVLLLGAGYQLGADGFAVYAASQGVSLAAAGLTPRDAIDAYRDAHAAIAGTFAGYTKDNRKWRSGGLWNDLHNASLSVVGDGGEVSVGRCTMYRDRGHLYVTLPSGREIIYRNARIVNFHRWGREVPQVVYASPRWKEAALYGGKLCWGGETRVLTSRGAVPIRDVTASDWLWDGVEWVQSDGAVHNGYQETGRWLDQLVTAGHLIHDGDSWRDVTHLDEASSARCLAFGRASVPSSFALLRAGKAPGATASVTVASGATSRLGGCCGKPSELASAAGGPERANDDARTATCSQPPDSQACGSTDTPEWYRDVLTGTIGRIETTEGGVLRFIPSGSPTDGASTSTSSRCPDGTSSDSTWTGSATMATTSRETFVWSRDGSTAPIAVYDVLNCGPRNRYTLVTPHGPIVAHNCENITQAVASDFIRYALVRMREERLRVVLHVHDEIVASGHRLQLPLFMKLMTELPPWATGFTLDAEGGFLPRYAKSPPKGATWREQTYRNGVRVK